AAANILSNGVESCAPTMVRPAATESVNASRMASRFIVPPVGESKRRRSSNCSSFRQLSVRFVYVEAVTESSHVTQVSWFGSVRFNLLSQTADVIVDDSI